MKNFIIGKNSNLSRALNKFIGSSKLISLENKKDIDTIVNYKSRYNLIFNNFYPVSLINKLDIKELTKFYQKSVLENINLLNKIDFKYVNKILYTSSSSVYGSFEKNNSFGDPFNRKFYSSIKLSNEKLFLNICEKRKLDCKILRIFNIYGGKNEKFSFVSKIIDSSKKKINLNVFNYGHGIRDFIHVNDICKIYKILLNKNTIKEKVLDVGSGEGLKIIDLIEYSGLNKKNIKYINEKIDELKISIANIDWLKKSNLNFKFHSIEKFVNKKKNKNKIYKFTSKDKNSLENFEEGTVIYGCGNAGKQIHDELKNKNEKVLFFIDDDKKLFNKFYKNIEIISYQKFKEISFEYNIKKIILSIPTLNKKREEIIISKLKNENFDVRSLPNKKFLNSDHISLNDLKYLNLDKILKNRDFKFEKINYFKNKNILVTGAAGSIGSEVCRQLLKIPTKKIIGLDNSELNLYNFHREVENISKLNLYLDDIKNTVSVENICKQNNIDVIIHCAAYKHVNILEKNPIQAFLNNTLATYNLCKISIKTKSDFLLVSTDKAVNPKSILGFSKLAAERLVIFLAKNLKANTNIINIVRFGNVIGSSGSAIPKFIDQINNNAPISITNKKATRYFMSINQACYLILKTFELKLNKKIFIFEMGNSVKVLDVINNLIKFKKKLAPSYEEKIVETGLRPGEKMHEELFYNVKKKKTVNKKIFFVEEKSTKSNNFLKYLKLADNFLKKNNNKNIKSLLKKFK